MKKILAILLLYILCFSAGISANAQTALQSGLPVTVNRATVQGTAIFSHNTHYIPLRTVMEALGASVYYRSSDSQVLALSRDGDLIRHIVGTNVITVNGEDHLCDSPSLMENGTTYLPLSMLNPSFCPDAVSYENGQLNIWKYLFQTDYHKVIGEVLAVSRATNFYPERFPKYLSYHIQMPAYTMEEVLFRVNLGLDAPFYETVTPILQPDEHLVLVNKYHQLPADYTPPNLVNMDRSYTSADGKEYLLNSTAYQQYVQMADAAWAEGISMRVVSAYRTESYQRGLYNRKVRINGTAVAERYSARPGFSEHQTGLAVDINSTYVSFDRTAAFFWLQEHAHEYGYILRYPKDKEWLTGYAYEPWHYRYVGTDAAKIIFEEGITYEEYYAKYISVNEFR